SAQHLAGADQMLLADHLVEAARPHPVSEGSGRRRRGGDGRVEEVHGESIRRGENPLIQLSSRLAVAGLARTAALSPHGRVWGQARATGRSSSESMLAVTTTPRRSSSAASAR